MEIWSKRFFLVNSCGSHAILCVSSLFQVIPQYFMCNDEVLSNRNNFFVFWPMVFHELILLYHLYSVWLFIVNKFSAEQCLPSVQICLTESVIQATMDQFGTTERTEEQSVAEVLNESMSYSLRHNQFIEADFSWAGWIILHHEPAVLPPTYLVYTDMSETINALEENIRSIIVDIRHYLLHKVAENEVFWLEFIQTSRGLLAWNHF